MNRTLFLSVIVLFLLCGCAEKVIDVSSVSISMSKVELEIGESVSLMATVSPSNATYDDVSWSSSMPSIASVDNNGFVRALSDGLTTITAMAGGKIATCSVTVVKGYIAVSSIALAKEYLFLLEGESESITATIEPYDATEQLVIWSSSDSSVASIDENGVITAINSGETIITGSAEGKTATCKVTVAGRGDNQPNNVIYYTNLSGAEDDPTDTYAFGVNLVSNVYRNGVGIITFDGEVSEIGYQAFSGKSILSIEVPYSVTTIGNKAFWYCLYLQSMEIPVNVESIGDSAFDNCRNLKQIFLPDGLKSIADRAFRQCHTLTSVNFPDSLESIGEFAFEACFELSSVVIPERITEISFRAFESCRALSSVILPAGLKTIEWGAFAGCESLTSIVIPDQVSYIGYVAFSGCSALTSIVVTAINPPKIQSDSFNNTGECPIFVPAESVERYKQRWKEYADRIQAIPEINGHAYVDMGNGIKWATCNVGANSPEEYGNYFAWGEVEQKADYSESKYDYKKEFEDAANVNWGSTWRMPTEEEWAWLLDNCDWTWTERKGVNGYSVSSRINGNRIFLPASGFYDDETLAFVGHSGLYWSLSPKGTENYYKKYLHFHDEKAFLSDGNRFNGLSVRPVSE